MPVDFRMICKVLNTRREEPQKIFRTQKRSRLAPELPAPSEEERPQDRKADSETQKKCRFDTVELF